MSWRQGVACVTTVGLVLAVSGAFDAAVATTYYTAPLSTSCNPATPGTGTLANPYRNPYYALTQGAVHCGDTLQLRGGSYRARFTAFGDDSTVTKRYAICDDDQQADGYDGTHTLLPLFEQCSASAPLTIENYPGEDVVLDGTDANLDTAGIWTPCSDGGDGPGGGNDTCCGTGGLSLLAPSETYCTTSLNVSNADVPQIWIDPTASTPGTRLQWWANSSAVIASDSATDHDSLPRGAFFSVNAGKPLVLRLPDGSNPSAHAIKMTVQAGNGAYSVVAANGAHYVTLRRNPAGGSVRVKYGYYPLYVTGGAQHVTFDGIEVMACGGRDYGNCLRVVNGSSVTFTHGIAREAMAECLALYGGGPGGQCVGGPKLGGACYAAADCPQSTCDARNGHGIQMADDVVSFSTATQCGRAWIDGGGQGTSLGQGVIVKNCSGCAVRGNTISQTFRSGIQVNTSTECGAGPAPCHSDGAVIDGNRIADSARFQDLASAAYPRPSQLGDGGSAGIYVGVVGAVAGSSADDPTITNNMICGAYTFRNMNNAPIAGIRLDSNISGTRIINNSVSGVAGPCINLQPVTTNMVTLRNNAMNSCAQTGTGCNGAPCALFVAPTPVHLHTNNTYWATSNINVVTGSENIARDSIAAAWEGSAVQADPLFLSLIDLHLQASSPLIGRGTITDAPAFDIDGELRKPPVDVGADQWAPTFVPPAAPTLLGVTPVQ
jgi:hypothetical protein